MSSIATTQIKEQINRRNNHYTRVRQFCGCGRARRRRPAPRRQGGNRAPLPAAAPMGPRTAHRPPPTAWCKAHDADAERAPRNAHHPTRPRRKAHRTARIAPSARCETRSAPMLLG